MSTKKQFWYNFSFHGVSRRTGRKGYSDCQIPVQNHDITLDVISTAKRAAGMNDQAVFISIHYLGYMSEAEFRGENENV